MSRSERSRKQQHDFWMDDSVGTLTGLLQISRVCTMDEAYEQTVREISDLLNLRPALPSSFDEADTIRARGMGVLIEFPTDRRM
jgi:hypothetical protein